MIKPHDTLMGNETDLTSNPGVFYVEPSHVPLLFLSFPSTAKTPMTPFAVTTAENARSTWVRGRLQFYPGDCHRPDHSWPSSSPGARFSKVPIINGPGKLSPFTLKIEVSIVLHLT